MDARVRALLEPKAFAKGSQKSAKKKTEGNSKNITDVDQLSANGQFPSHKPSSSAQSVPAYDPRKLLDPRGARQSAKPQKSNPYLRSFETDSNPGLKTPSSQTSSPSPQVRRENSGSRSMIEDLYGVQKRSERPLKRVKLDADQEENKNKSRGAAKAFHSSGIVGEYMRSNADEPGQTTDHKKIVDLTDAIDGDDSDDDLKVVKALNINNEQEVVFGRISLNVHAHAVPKPREMQNIYGDMNQWPMTKCVAVRTPSKNTVIEVKDPFNFVFGRIEPEMANVLAPLMDVLKKFRLEIWVTPRKKKPNELPHQPCSETMFVAVNVYGRRIDAERVGKIFGQRNIWLKSPSMVTKGCETVNPHADRFRSVVPQDRGKPKQFYSESRTIEEATEAVTKLFDHYANTAKPLLETEAEPSIMTSLLPHQKQALTFMIQKEQPRTYGPTESENSSLWRKKRKNNGVYFYEEIITGITLNEEPDEVYGGLLGDVMGLGKTIEALALITSTMKDAEHFGSQRLVRADASEAILLTQSKGTLIVAPVSAVKNWEDQIQEHIKPNTLSYYVYHGPHREKDPVKLAQYDIVISTYSTIAVECSAKSVGTSSIKMIRWFRIILDEAHTIRESRASQSQAMYSLFAQRRWCLTGTPIQNRLDDLGSLTRFIRLYPYDTTMRFNQYVRSPAQSGDNNYLKSLRVFIDSFTLRRLKDRVDLPDRSDLVVGLQLSPDERRVYDFFKKGVSDAIKSMAAEQSNRTVSQHHVLRAIMKLRLICNHGRELLKQDDLEALKGDNEHDAIVLEADQHTKVPTITPHEAYNTLSMFAEADLDMCRQCDKRITGDSPQVEAEPSEDVRGYMLPCYDLLCTECFEFHKGVIDDMDEEQLIACPLCQAKIAAQYIPIPKATAELLEWTPEDSTDQTNTNEAYTMGNYTGPSTKVRALLDDLHTIRQESSLLVAQGEMPLKSIIFSEFTSNLDLIERGLDGNGFEGCHVRIDGTMSLSKRKIVIDSLNTDNSVTILLASIKAAGQGLNLTAASRAFIMEPMWNPAAESQAVDRIYRIGQHRNVVIRRYQINNSIEGKIIELQRKKQTLADISMNKNHQLLSKKESRERHMKEILSLFK